jgi:hypothetical protein
MEAEIKPEYYPPESTPKDMLDAEFDSCVGDPCEYLASIGNLLTIKAELIDAPNGPYSRVVQWTPNVGIREETTG